jgi:hypothetical protein
MRVAHGDVQVYSLSSDFLATSLNYKLTPSTLSGAASSEEEFVRAHGGLDDLLNQRFD